MKGWRENPGCTESAVAREQSREKREVIAHLADFASGLLRFSRRDAYLPGSYERLSKSTESMHICLKKCNMGARTVDPSQELL
jgi:hypothetical protein